MCHSVLSHPIPSHPSPSGPSSDKESHHPPAERSGARGADGRGGASFFVAAASPRRPTPNCSHSAPSRTVRTGRRHVKRFVAGAPETAECVRRPRHHCRAGDSCAARRSVDDNLAPPLAGAVNTSGAGRELRRGRPGIGGRRGGGERSGSGERVPAVIYNRRSIHRDVFIVLTRSKYVLEHPPPAIDRR